MTEILRFLVDRVPFLYAPGRFRFVDSGTSTSFGGDAFLTLASDVLRIRMVRDRGQLFMDVQSVGETGDLAWYSIDVVRWLITGEQPASAELSADDAAFLETHLDEIERRFSQEEAPTTIAALTDLEKKRAKELFG